MHPYFFSQRYREQLAYYERQAEIRRNLRKRERQPLKRFGSLLARSPRRSAASTSFVPPAKAEARPCP
jgi:hypothetical protein